MTVLTFTDANKKPTTFGEIPGGSLFTLPNKGGLFLKLAKSELAHYNTVTVVAPKSLKVMKAGMLERTIGLTIVDLVSEVEVTLSK